MYKIAVCDDEIKILEDINRMIKKHQPDAEVSTYSNGERLLKAMEEENYDVVLLDIDMPGISGMEVAAAMTEDKRKSLIVFVTAHDELVYDSFKYHPFAFVRKKYLREELPEVLADCIREVETKEKRFHFRAEGGQVSVLLSDICYFEAEGNYLIVHLKKIV